MEGNEQVKLIAHGMQHCLMCHQTNAYLDIHYCLNTTQNTLELKPSKCRFHCPTWTRELNPYGKPKSIHDVQFKFNEKDEIIIPEKQ